MNGTTPAIFDTEKFERLVSELGDGLFVVNAKGEIERMEGRLKFLADRAAFSTITVTFQPKRQEETSRGPFRLPVPWLYQLGLSRLLNL